MEEQEINVVIRVMPNADDVDVSLPLNATPADVIETLLDADLDIPRIDPQGNPISFQLVPKGANVALDESESLKEGRVQDNDVVLMIPKVIAGCNNV